MTEPDAAFRDGLAARADGKHDVIARIWKTHLVQF
jgi:hypothetical protein